MYATRAATRVIIASLLLVASAACEVAPAPVEAIAPPAELPAPEPEAPPIADWALLVHFSGSGESVVGDLGELMAGLAGPETGQRIAVAAQIETGESSRRLRVLPGQGFVDEGGRFVQRMSPAARVADFARWGRNFVQARRYALVLRDLGGAWHLYSGERTPAGLGAALDAADVSLDLIAFDSGHIASLEAAFSLAGRAEILVASQSAAIPGGWPFDAWLRAFPRGESATPAAVGTGLVDVAYAFLDETRPELSAGVAYSALRLDAARALAGGVAALGVWLRDAVSEQGRGPFAKISAMRAPAQSFDLPGSVDLGDLTERFAEGARSPRLAELASLSGDLLAPVVLYELHGDARPGASGLSIQMPLRAEASTLEAYGALPFARDYRWAELLTKLSAQAEADRAAPYVAAPAVRIVDLENTQSGVRFRSWVTTVDLEAAHFELYRANLAQERFERIFSLPVTPDDEGYVAVEFPLVGWALTDGERTIGAAIEADRPSYLAFSRGHSEHFLADLPVAVEREGEEARDRVVLRYVAERSGADAAFVTARSPVEPGQRVWPLVRVAGEDGTVLVEATTNDGEGLIVPEHGQLWLTTLDMGSGEQVAVGLWATDHSGNESAGFVDFQLR